MLEGWKELGLNSPRISLLLGAYPEHTELLRRCRNAIYHFQKTAIDPRIERMIQDESEELRWAAALHFEFQGFFLQFSDRLRFLGPQGREAIEGIAEAIGWFPVHPFADKIKQLEELCTESEKFMNSSDEVTARSAREFIDQSRKMIEGLDLYPLTTRLSRITAIKPSAGVA